MKFHNDTENNKPKVREFKQFVSPNPKTANNILLFKEVSTKDIGKLNDKFKDYKNLSGLSAFIVDTTACPHIRDDTYLNEAKKELSCPFLRFEHMTEIDNIFDSRLMQFDGQITSAKNFNQKEFFNLYKLAQAQDLLIIPYVSQKEDWQKVMPAAPKIIYLDTSYDNELPPVVKEANIWLLGMRKLKEKYNLKCVIDECKIW